MASSSILVAVNRFDIIWNIRQERLGLSSLEMKKSIHAMELFIYKN
jgi:hypothetical protein